MYINIKSFAGLAAAALIAGAATAVPTPDYLKQAGASDLYEKTSSQLVLKTTKDPKVRSFAQMMISDHTSSTAKIKAAASKSGVMAPPPMLMPKQQTMVQQLTAATGTARDKLYVDQQKMAHQEALALHQDYSTTGDKAPLKAVATQVVPVVQHHIQMLGTM